jgi:hypothetical protein
LDVKVFKRQISDIHAFFIGVFYLFSPHVVAVRMNKAGKKTTSKRYLGNQWPRKSVKNYLKCRLVSRLPFANTNYFNHCFRESFCFGVLFLSRAEHYQTLIL